MEPSDRFVATLNKGEIRSAISRVMQFADERSHAIRLEFTSGEVCVSGSNLVTGESQESVPIEYTGPDIVIGFNAQYLLDFLDVIAEDQVVWILKDQNTATELRPAGDAVQGLYRYVLMPMRV
jgi:DNA polymerase-3 subunit beta